MQCYKCPSLRQLAQMLMLYILNATEEKKIIICDLYMNSGSAGSFK